MMIYLQRDRMNDPHALPNGEVFYVSGSEARETGQEEGWYWQACFPGCLPDGEPSGPFSSEDEALRDAQGGMEDEEE